MLRGRRGQRIRRNKVGQCSPLHVPCLVLASNRCHGYVVPFPSDVTAERVHLLAQLRGRSACRVACSGILGQGDDGKGCAVTGSWVCGRGRADATQARAPGRHQRAGKALVVFGIAREGFFSENQDLFSSQALYACCGCGCSSNALTAQSTYVKVPVYWRPRKQSLALVKYRI